MTTVENIVCPHCLKADQLVAVGEDRRCPRCGKIVDVGEWPTVRGHDELSPCSSVRLPGASSSVGAHGALRSSLPFAFAYGKTCVRIGGSALQADIVIDGAAPLQTVLLQSRRTKSWWIYDCCEAVCTTVNGNLARFHELQIGDRIGICGIVLAFRGNRLESDSMASSGLSLRVCDMVARVEGLAEPILDHVTFSVNAGEFVGVLGASGCGKSSLVQRIVGLSNEYEGEVLVNGHDRREVEAAFRATTAYLPQNVDQSLHEALTLEEEIACFRKLHLAPSADDGQDNDDCLAALGLSGREASRIGTMSGGEKRRVGIALALLRKPRLMLLDEPGAGLDPASELTLMRHLRGVASQGRTVLCVTHVLAHADMFDKVLILSHGRVVYYGRPEGVFAAFRVTDWANLYELLAEGTAQSHYTPPVEDRTLAEVAPGSRAASFWQVVKGYVTRFWRSFVFRQSIFTSQPAVFWLWQPLGLVFGIRIACAYYLNNDIETLAFCASLSMFWTGINNAARDFVRERVPGRCLERLNNVSYGAYLTSRVVWMVALSVVATASYTALLCVSCRLPLPLVNGDCVGLSVSPLWFIPLTLVSIMGGLFGLAVSAASRKEIGAVSLVPNIAILALLFSGSVICFETNSLNEYMHMARMLAERVMPCHWPSKVMAEMQRGDFAFTPACLCMLRSFAAYALISSVVIFHCQRRHERGWNGR